MAGAFDDGEGDEVGHFGYGFFLGVRLLLVAGNWKGRKVPAREMRLYIHSLI